MEFSVSKGGVLRNDVTTVEENESQSECFADEILLDESDIPGPSLKGKRPCLLNNTDAKRRPKKRCTPGKSAWRGHYCCVPLCRNSSSNQKERERLGLEKLSFHSFPNVETPRGKEWIRKIRRETGPDFVITKTTKICSAHFKPDDFFFSEFNIQKSRCHLKPTAVPSIFAWNPGYSRASVTSQIASSSKLRCQLIKPVSEFNVNNFDENFCNNTEAFHDINELDSMTVNTENIEDTTTRIQKLTDKIEELQGTITELSDRLHQVEDSAAKSLFRYENIKDRDELVKFYTGFPDHLTLLAFYEEILESDAKVMRQWDGKKGKVAYDELKCGRACKLALLEQLFMTLVRLRLGLPELDLAQRFNVSQSSVSRITMTWINLMYHNLKALEYFPPFHIIKKYMPEPFKTEYPNTRLIIDATEFSVERPSSLLSQATTFSAYKNTNTVKVLVGITPSGAISFVSQAYEGSIADRELVEFSGLLDKLEAGDELMADKGFLIQDLLTPIGVRLNVPPLLNSKRQMPADDVLLTKKIAQLRVHVERAIGRIKEYRILHNTLPATMWDSINEVIYVCCMMTNFSPPLVC